jgi:two-component system response regulator FixJ
MLQEVPNVAPRHIFAIDDDPSVRKALQRLFKSSGFSVEIFGSAAEFLESGRQKKAGCLVIDIHMPNMNGFELLRKLAVTGTHLPAVVITGQDTESTRAQARECGAAAYFVKPFDNDQLVRSVREAFEKMEARK